MKMPERPPSMAHIREQRMDVILKLVSEGDTRDRYFHWDELRRRTPPVGATPTEWWFALKITRSLGRHSLRLMGTDGIPFSFITPGEVLAALHRVDIGAGSNVIDSDPLLTPSDRDRYITSSLIEEAITSSQLEGATTTRVVAKELIRSRRKVRDRSEQMILNNYLTMERIRELRSEDLTPALVLELHRTVTEGALDDPSAAGRLRRADESVAVMNTENVVFHQPPPAAELAARMKAMCEFANGSASTKGSAFIHPVIRAIALHFWLAYDHPFVDGNGRTARALFYWSMLRAGYWLFEFVSISRLLLRAPTAYARSFLFTETDGNDLTYFIVHQTQIVMKAIDDLQAYIQAKSAESRTLRADLKQMRTLNHRQQALIGHALKHAQVEYTIEVHRRSHDVTYATARADLLQLVELGLLNMTKQGRKHVFEATPDLERKLRKSV